MSPETRPNSHDARDSHQRVVIVGGGMAGARLVQQLGARQSAGGAPVEVTVIGEEPHRPYNRVLLAEVLAGRYPPEVIGLPKPAGGVRWRGGVRAVRIDRAERRVACDDGGFVDYDALVLATGSNPVLPPLRGLFVGERPGGNDALPAGVHAFRTMDDCLALAGLANEDTPAVVIGGGLLGVSAARALAQRGAQVILAHQGEHLMERHLDPGAAQLLRTHLVSLGVEVHTECRVRGLLTRTAPDDRRVYAVELANGFRLAAEVVVLACGVRPRTGLARAAGLRVDRGIVVDDLLRTSDPLIHAVGDCAEHRQVVYGLAGPAQEQADLLAQLLCRTASAPHSSEPHPSHPRTSEPHPGEPHPASPRYTGTRALTRLTLAAPPTSPTSPTPPTPPTPPEPRELQDPQAHPASHAPCPGPLDLATFGETQPRPEDDVVHLSDATRQVYRKVVLRGDRLVGGILLGDLGSVGALARTWESDEPLPAAPLLHLLTHDGGS